MSETLGGVIKKAREGKGFSVRELGRITGIHNAHLSQIETGTIKQPNQPMLFALSEALGLDFERLLALAGHVADESSARSRRHVAGVLLRGLDDLDDAGQQELLRALDKLRRKRR